jgi:two-component system, NtrC family, response regulator AtoC
VPKAKVLVAEDDRVARGALAELLESCGFVVLTAENGSEAEAILERDSPDVGLLDIRMPGIDGLTVLRRARGRDGGASLIVMTAHGDSSTAIDAMKSGAFDYVTKPIDFDQLLPHVERAIERRRLSQSLAAAGGDGEPRAGATAGTIVGRSPAMQHVYKLIGQVAASDATVLVRGESGTGKELVVNAIHFNSARAAGPLVKVNCASIPETLLESELFGHERGAFTNAVSRRIGRFEQAAGGTLFLDEIGELTPALQSKLLRAVQERTIERLGSNAPLVVDIRLITATSRNLEEAVQEGEFREDLYYRLNVVTVPLPPLRERRQDIPALVEHFLRRNGKSASITAEALGLLAEHSWPGNVRELENAMERALVLARNGVVTADEIELREPLAAGGVAWEESAPLERGWSANVAAVEKSMIVRALREAGGNKSRAAERLGIHRRLLYEKMRQYGMA